MKPLGTIFAVIPLLVVSACGYRWGFVRPEGVRTIAVPVFENDTFRRGVEIALTEEVSKEIAERSGFLLESADRADALLKGRILAIQDQVVQQAPQGQVRSAIVWITVQAQLVDRRTGKILRNLELQDRGQYLTDNLQDRDTATTKAVQRLAQKIAFSLASKPSAEHP